MPAKQDKRIRILKAAVKVFAKKGFYNAVEDIQPDKSFVVYAGEDRYPVAEGVEAIGVTEMAHMLLEKSVA